jgi:hypothetical protein
MTLNAEWHRNNKIPKNPTEAERLRWHTEHSKHCNCRPFPAKLAKKAK